ncbi:ABC transporter, transmembrane domain, type 1 [Akanthomyces lecanii RCEF 1005]|uniref:ABC transporter, transmembrane domain, type 1 n=1 Tax=Akanthomyces lecanii RCEF 1005 TaxID=1081108 RepID=A0A168CQ01_CORDF|nr:ABC transporter, transmembrane domain, type 1 [Akanthomyces lecanii RCEF 1005]
MTLSCPVSADNVFGPAVAAPCRAGFDFTLLFEETVLTILPLSLAICWVIGRLVQLRSATAKVTTGWLLASKLLLWSADVALQVVQLALWVSRGIPRTETTVACLALCIVGSVSMLICSHREHVHVLRPSTPLIVFLGVSLILDLARTRTLFFYYTGKDAVAIVNAVGYGVKLLLFIAENVEKRQWLRPQWAEVSREEASGVLNRSLFIWLNPLFTLGFGSKLTLKQLFSLDAEIKSAARPVELMEEWELSSKSSSHALFWQFLRHYKWQFLAGVLPRLSYSGFLFAQPFLLERVLDFIDEQRVANTDSTAYGLIAAYGVVYIGIAHKTYRLLTLYRGSLIALIYNKTLKMNVANVTDAEAITLMSADIDRIGHSLPLIHELYASLLDIAIALWLLYGRLGIAMIAPIIWIALFTIAGLPIAGAADFASSAVAPVWGFGVYSILAKARGTPTLTEGVAFAALSLFELMNQPLIHIVDGFEHIQTVRTSFRRVQEYLESDEREDYRVIVDRSPLISDDEKEKLQILEKAPSHHQGLNAEDAVTLANVSAAYSVEGDPVLANLNLSIKKGETTMVFGPVGCGKSTFLRLLLGEMASVVGEVTTCFSTAAFCPQTPWITWGSIQSNVVGILDFEEKWYNIVAHACLLLRDFQELSDGDQTNTGSRGSRLSGGQQMRVSFARALYSKRPVMVLDDVLTGLDRVTERGILERVFGPGGLLKEMESTVIMATNSFSHLQFADNIIILNEKGQIARQGRWEAISADSAFAHHSVHDEPVVTHRPELEISDETMQEIGVPLDANEDSGGDDSAQPGDLQVYAFYARVAGVWPILAYLFACSVFVFGVNFPSVWLQKWTNYNSEHPNERIGYYLGVYGALAGLTLLGCSLADSVFNLVVIPRTSKKFHELLLTTTMRAPTSFVTSTDTGTIINRFSQDLELIDNDLPKSLDQTVFQLLSAVMSAVLVFISSGYVAIAIPFCIAVIAVIQLYYLRTSRQVRILDIEAKAPLFSQFLETLGGISCIRSFGWVAQYESNNRDALNSSQKPYYTLWCIQRWLTLVLDLFVAGLAVLLVGLATNIRDGSTGFLGVALFQVVTFSTTLQVLVAEWTQVEMALGAISRIRSYVLQTKNENQTGENGTVPEEWPNSSAIIEFKNVTASFDGESEPILKNLSFTINMGEKVAICGRTGSGKSSTISALLRMLELDGGSIHIGQVDISTLPRQLIRSRLNSVPQEPFFLHGSVRCNIDPTEDAADDRIHEVLESVGLWELFQSRGGLDEDMNEETLSHGQRQLFCLARAALSSANIIIMDEATSGVDEESENLMESVIAKEFQTRTVISVAHKLDAILDYSRVILLDKGVILETGQPRELLAKSGSAFKAFFDGQRRG